MKRYYAAVCKKSLKVGVFLEKSQVCKYINVTVYYFDKNFVGGKYENETHCVQFVDQILIKSLRGDKKGRNLP